MIESMKRLRWGSKRKAKIVMEGLIGLQLS